MIQCRLLGLPRVLALAAALALSCVSLDTPAQARKPGGYFAEFALNNPNSLHGNFADPLVARLRGRWNGRFVIVTTVAATPYELSGTYFQIYNAQGTPLGNLTRATASGGSAAGNWAASGVAAAGNGFVLVWEAWGAAGEIIRGQRYSAAGAKLGPEFKINTTPDGSKWTNSTPTVAGLVDGGFVVAWLSFYHWDFYPGGPPVMIFAQRYDAQGREIGGNFVVRNYLLGPFSVTGLADGGFAFAYTARDGNTVFVQRYAADGTKAGGELAASRPPYLADPTIVSLNSGGFVVACSHVLKREVYARRFSAAGLPDGPAFSASAQGVYYWKTTVSVLDDDRLLFTYNTEDAIYARVFGLNDDHQPEFRVNTTPRPGSGYFTPAAVALSDRNAFVAWATLHGGDIGAERLIWLRRLNLPAAK